MINMGRIMLNLLIIAITMFVGYILPFNVFKFKNKIANRFYPGKLGILKILWSFVVFYIYLVFLHYVRSILLNNFGNEEFKIYTVRFIMLFYIYPIIFIAWLTRAKYGNFKIIYSKPKPDENELRNEIMNFSFDQSGLNEKSVMIGLCKYYLKRFGKNEDILKAMKKVNENKIQATFNLKILLSLLILLVILIFRNLIKISIVFAFLSAYIITDTIFTKSRLFGKHTKVNSS